MKNHFLLALFVTFLACTTACSTSEQTSGNQNTELSSEKNGDTISDDNNIYRSLAEFLQRVPGVQVSGSGTNTSVVVRGASSFMASIEPLYVIDGNAVGTNYNQVNSMLNVRDIDNVRVLKGSDASIYGVRGSNGVIVITTKR